MRGQGSNPTLSAISLVLEAARPALHSILDQVGPDKLDDPGVVVAVREIVI